MLLYRRIHFIVKSFIYLTIFNICNILLFEITADVLDYEEELNKSIFDKRMTNKILKMLNNILHHHLLRSYSQTHDII